MRKKESNWSRWIWLRPALLGIAGAVLASASSINLNFPSSPDLFLSEVRVVYDFETSTLVASGYIGQFNYDDGAGLNQYQISSSAETAGVFPGTFSLTANVNHDGTLGSAGGGLTVGGYIDGLPGFSGSVGDSATDSLLIGNLIQFGFAETPDGKLEFVFQVTGGDLAPLYGAEALMVLSSIGPRDPGDSSVGFNGDFSASFSSYDPTFALGDIGAVPEPGTLPLVGAAGACCYFLRRRLFGAKRD